MTALALGLLMAAALGHAVWNFLAKRAAAGVPFVWLFSALGAGFYAPLAAAVVALQRPPLGPAQLGFMAGTAVLHLAYFVLLQGGYAVGDLSVVYPLARGTGPLLATAAAIALFGERPSPLALAGACLVVAGAFTVARRGGGPGGARPRGVAAGLLVGALIACYTLWDKHAVGVLRVPPLLQDWAANFGRAALLTPLALRRRAALRETWRRHRGEAAAIGLLAPLSYILVLTAMAFTPVSYVAPAREVSVLVGTFLGSRVLGEGEARRRLAAAGLMLVGLVALAAG